MPTHSWPTRRAILSAVDGSTFAIDSDGFVKSVERLHVKVHEGKMLSVSSEAVLASAASFTYLIQVSTAPLHIHWAASATDNTDVLIFEGPTFSAAGTGVTPINHNRSSATVLTATITHTPTTSADGTQLFEHHIAQGSKIGGAISGVTEMILAPSTDYLVRFLSGANGNTVGWQLYMYEGTVPT